MNNSAGVWKFLGIAVLVTVVSLAGGYYFSSGPSKSQATVNPTATVPTDTTTAAAPQPRAAGPTSEYTAPDAPAIDIKEVKPLAGAKKPDKPADSEASETGVVPATDSGKATSGLITTPTEGDSANAATDSPTPALTPPAPPTPPTPPPATGDVPGVSIPEPVQPPAAAGGTDTPVQTGPVFHVLVGNTFADEKNARIFASALRRRGYMAVTEPINSGDGTIYRVQVGAYHNRVSAEDEVNLLQQSGYPAYIAPDR